MIKWLLLWATKFWVVCFITVVDQYLLFRTLRIIGSQWMNCLTLAWEISWSYSLTCVKMIMQALSSKDFVGKDFIPKCKQEKKTHSFCSLTANISRDKIWPRAHVNAAMIVFLRVVQHGGLPPFIHLPRLRYHTHQWKEGTWWTSISLGKSSDDRETMIWLTNILKWLSWLFATQKNGV